MEWFLYNCRVINLWRRLGALLVILMVGFVAFAFSYIFEPSILVSCFFNISVGIIGGSVVSTLWKNQG